MRELVHMVAQAGLRLHGAYLPEGVRGLYSPGEGRIYFDLRLTPNEVQSTIAHELGHHHYGHDCSTDANERQSDVYAARLLIRLTDYAAAARVTPHAADIADALGVTEDIVHAYETYLARMNADRLLQFEKFG